MKDVEKKSNFIICVVLLLASLPLCGLAMGSVSNAAPTRLKTEFLDNPQDVDTTQPRFSWIVEDTTPGAIQTAYQLQAASSPDFKEPLLWDSGKVDSDQSHLVPCAGKPLASGQHVFWRVKSWDKDGQPSDWSTPASFAVGLLDPSDWQAQWIAVPLPEPVETPHFGFRSREAASDSETKWVQIDLGRECRIDSVTLRGAWPVDAYQPPGDGFPLRFKIEAASQADFSDARIVTDRTAEDFTGDLVEVGTNPVRFGFEPVSARYVRLTATKLSGSYEMRGPFVGVWDEEKQRHTAVPEPRKTRRSSWKLALAEMEVFSEKENVALGAAVSASDAFEDDAAAVAKAPDYERKGWRREFLTDGRVTGTPGAARSPQPVAMLRKEFESDRPVKRAVLHVTALGNYEARINGQKVGDHKLAPGLVNYTKRVLYQTHDVTGMLREGGNVLAALLADGWYRQRERTDNFGSAQRHVPAEPALLLAQLEIEYADGSRAVVATDGSWQCHTDGPLRYASMYDGITYDVRKEVPGWDVPGRPAGPWRAAVVAAAPKIALNAQAQPPVRVRRTLAPVAVTEAKPGVRIYDFGTSMAGYCRVTLDGPAGSEVSLRYVEALRPDGSLFLANLDGNHDNADLYILDGKGPRTFEPDFTYHGFRYVEATGDLGAIREVAACDISTDMPQTGFFESSDPRLNTLCDIIERAYRSNTPSMIIDVAGRDERQSWMGDCFTDEVQALAFLFDSPGMIANVVRGVYDTANADGLPRTHATINQPPGKPAVAGWADGGVTGAWSAWVNFADRRGLEAGYAGSARYMESIAAKSKDGLPGDNYQALFGDWLSTRNTLRPGAKSWKELGGKGAPDDLFAAAMWGQAVDLTARMARALGKDDEARRWEELLATIRTAIAKNFVRADGTIEGGGPSGYAMKVPPVDGPSGGDEQSCYALTLGMNHLDGDLRRKAGERLLDAIRKNDSHFGTGSFTTTYLLRAMSDMGLQDLAYEMVMKPTCPSYRFMVDSGATAMWERWDSYHPQLGFNPERMNGFNHLGMNSVYEWIFTTLVGIRPDPAHPGYKHFFIQPQPPKGLDWVKARYESVRGPIAVEWKRNGSAIDLNVTVPWNTTATVKLPDGHSEEIAAGKHQFTISTGEK